MDRGVTDLKVLNQPNDFSAPGPARGPPKASESESGLSIETPVRVWLRFCALPIPQWAVVPVLASVIKIRAANGAHAYEESGKLVDLGEVLSFLCRNELHYEHKLCIS